MSQSPDSNVSTHGIRVQARAQYLHEHSDPDHSQYLFAYTITITNEGAQPAQLLSRHWVILDANNHREDVRGPGVVGETPRLAPDQNFQYQSACPLTTPWGTMEGTYLMRRDDGSTFSASIGRFFLVADELKAKAKTSQS